MSKGPDAFRTISEVAEELDLPQHVLRFWETRFTQIKPMKRGGGRRYYRPDDVELLRGIRRLLYGEGYTIKGVQRILKEQGARHVIGAGQGKGLDPAPHDADGDDYGDELLQDQDFAASSYEDDFASSDHADAGRREPTFGGHSDYHVDPEDPSAHAGAGRSARSYGEERVEPSVGASRIPVAPPDLPASADAYRPRYEAARSEPWHANPHTPEPSIDEASDDFEQLDQDLADAIPQAPETTRLQHPAEPALAVSDRERLRATLMDLLECKRILDNVR
jgi:DNA-binding transcriptional MerR regulator